MSLVQELSDDLQTIDARARANGDTWTGKVNAFGQACIAAATAAGDDCADLAAKDLLQLSNVERLAATAHKKDPPAVLALAKYLINLPGYQPLSAGKQKKVTCRQHELVAHQLVEAGKSSAGLTP